MASEVIGLTGAFGGGCSTAARYLRDERAFTILRLSDEIKRRWKLSNSGEPSRSDLQSFGDQLRETEGLGVLVNASLEQLSGKADRIVIDGIRNPGEIERLRDLFGYRFWLVATIASAQDRWGRVGSEQYRDKGLAERDFHADDLRDKGEEGVSCGQQVDRCIDRADILVSNGSEVTLAEYKDKILGHVDLAFGRTLRNATQREIFMNMAYSAAASSKCASRSVGAVVIDPSGGVAGVGYNENPPPTKPCIEEPKYQNRCYRDIVRDTQFEQLAESHAKCPKCGKALEFVPGPPWLCAACKTNLEAYFFPNRARSWCTAIHAEVAALFAAGRRARGGQLFATTCPCFQCAEKIVLAGISEVCFTEAYPDNKAQARLDLAGVRLVQFEGVRSASFERIFAARRPH
jgi:deoxycytidylate deaminase/dephospho-CoA kinase